MANQLFVERLDDSDPPPDERLWTHADVDRATHISIWHSDMAVDLRVYVCLQYQALVGHSH